MSRGREAEAVVPMEGDDDDEEGIVAEKGLKAGFLATSSAMRSAGKRICGAGVDSRSKYLMNSSEND